LVRVVDGVVREARIAFGGMAATPKRAAAVEADLVGRPWSVEAMRTAAGRLQEDFRPISDMRASAGYRLQAARNMLVRMAQDDMALASLEPVHG